MTLPPPIPLEEAQDRLLAMVEPLGSETSPVTHAAGRYLGSPLPARRTQPAADLSAMDGYAVREADATGPWTVVGESAAGHPFVRELDAGEAVRISTGALMPPGAGAVLLQEDAQRDGDRLEALNGSPTSRHIRRTGFDFGAGEVMLPAGTRIGPPQIALALAGGHANVAVGRRPAIAILDSGDELAADPADCAPHQIPASNGAMLAAMAAPLASRVTRIGPVPDRMEALLAALEQAERHDVLVTSGGASVGDHDLVRPALEQWGAAISFWRVAIRPGKPLMVAQRGGQIVLGLPGNPVSSYVTAFLFLLPLLRALGGAAHALPSAVEFRLSGPLPASGSRLELLRARHTEGQVAPIAEQDSSALVALASSNALIRREIGAPAAAVGDVVPAYLLSDSGDA